MARLLIMVLIALFLVLQYRLWVGEGSWAEVYSLRKEIDNNRTELAQLRQRNSALQAEVDDLKRGIDAIEERARSELGMIKEGEIFYQIIEKEEEK